MENSETKEARARIIEAAIKLFSEKGYDATRVSEIAELAQVNKALIYYYFKNKEEVIDYLVNHFMEDITKISMDFLVKDIVSMIKMRKLDIKKDRLQFINNAALKSYLQSVKKYMNQVIEHVVEYRQIIRILMLESLKTSKHHNALFRFLDIMKEGNNPVFKTIWDADHDFSYSKDTILYRFFFIILPLMSFAAYYDDYRDMSSLNNEEMKESLLHFYELQISALISGTDVLLPSKI